MHITSFNYTKEQTKIHLSCEYSKDRTRVVRTWVKDVGAISGDD